MSGEEGNKQPYFQLNGQNMTVDQYNQMNRQKVMDFAQKHGREVVEPSRPGQARFSLFGPVMLPTPLTDAQFKARGQYAASRRGTPEQNAFNQKVNALIQSGVGIGYGNYAKDGKVYNSATGQQVTGYGYGDLSVPQFFTGGQSMGSNLTNNNSGAPAEPRTPPPAPTNAFLDGLNADLANYSGYTVNSDLDAAEQNLRNMLVNAQNNNADASTIGRIQMALDDIGRLGQDRTYQQGIIDQARRDAQSNLTNFGTSYTDVDYRNAQALDSLSRQLDQITNPNLDVDLNYDFSDLAGDVDPYREVVQNMRDRRMRELNALGEDIAGIGNTLEGFYSNVGNSIPDGIINDKAVPSPGDPFIIDRLNEALNTRNEDGTISDRRDVPLTPPEFEMVLGENGFLTPVLKAPDSRYAYEDKSRRQLRDIQSASEVYDIRDRLNEALNSLDVYGVGDRSNELRGQIFNQDEIYGQLADQLRGRQGQIETDAQAQLDALAEARLTRPDDIRSFEEALRDLSGQRDLFDAAIAADELERLTDQVQRARSDLERDEAARIARQQLERMRALQTQGAAGFNNNYMTADDYSAYLRALEMGRDDQYFEGMGTSFSRALGLA